MDNDKLHKVFPGFDYTPLNVQHPYCIHDPPSQNNITRDVAVLSQLTNVIRLYGMTTSTLPHINCRGLPHF